MVLHYYQAFQLNIASEMQFPQMHAIIPAENIDIFIKLGTIQKSKSIKAGYTLLTSNKVLFIKPNVAAYLIESGNQITIEPFEESDINEIMAYALSSAMTALLHQRSIIPLHACGIVHENKCHIFLGKHKAGKSTTAAAFFKRGFRVVCDDLCVIQKHSQKDTFLVYPGYPNIKLWQDSLQVLNLPYEHLTRVYSQENKFYLPIQEVWHTEPVELGSITMLNSPDAHLPILDNIINFKFNIIRSNLHRPKLIRLLSMLEYLNDFCSNLNHTLKDKIQFVDHRQQELNTEHLVDMLLDKCFN